MSVTNTRSGVSRVRVEVFNPPECDCDFHEYDSELGIEPYDLAAQCPVRGHVTIEVELLAYLQFLDAVIRR